MDLRLPVGPRVRKSPFFDAAAADGMTHATVYNHMIMPVHYGDAAAEYDRLINGVAMWDVAVQRQVEIAGPDADTLTRYLTTRDLSDTRKGQGRYAPLCDHDGVLINDPVLLPLPDGRYWLSLADSDIRLWAAAIAAERGLDVRISEPDVSPLAVQGPKAEAVVAVLVGDWVKDLRFFAFDTCELDGIPLLIARSGWSKQGGFELYLLDGSRGVELWNKIKEAGKPFDIGPGAPNHIERIESGLLSYGADTDERSNPYELGLGKYVDLDRDEDFIGKTALTKIFEAGPARRQVGLFIEGEPVESNPHRYPVMRGDKQIGSMSVTTYSPRLSRSIAIALVDAPAAQDGLALRVAFPDGIRQATVTGLPFC